MKDFRFLDRLVAPLGFAVPKEPAAPMSRKLRLLLVLPGFSPVVTFPLIHWLKSSDPVGVARFAPVLAVVGIVAFGLYIWLWWRVTIDQHWQQLAKIDHDVVRSR